MLQDYNTLYREKSTGKIVRVKRVCPGEHIVLTEAGDKERISKKLLSKRFKFIRQLRKPTQNFNYGESHAY